MERTHFFKYTANGNDFIIVDESQFHWTQDEIAEICQRHFGVGADGVLVVGRSLNADATMRIFNSDGREAEMCGNGLRCLVHYLYDFVEKKDSYVIKTMNDTFTVTRKNERFFIDMNVMKDVGTFDLSLFKEFPKSYFINTGVPHLCFLVEDVKKINIKDQAPFYRHHPLFPKGTNVNFIQVMDGENQTAYVRTYERGVEDETFSCGTGVTASAHALHSFLGWKGNIKIFNLGGEHLVELSDRVLFSGTERFVFKGEK